MGYSQENGYVPTDIDAIMLSIMGNINTQFELDPPFTVDTFEGTNLYKYMYALAQELQANEVKTSEIFAKLQQYFIQINALISRPAVTNRGIVDKVEAAVTGYLGYQTSVKPMIEADAGKINVCVDVDDGVQAEGLVTITSYANLVSGTDDSISVAGTAFTAQVGAATLGTATFQAATSNAATAASLALQINSHATVSLSVRARAIGAAVEIKAIHGGAAGNAIALAYTNNDANVGATVSGAFLTGGEDNEDYEAARLAICTILSNCIVGGIVSVGTESESITLTNGQSFDWKYNVPNRVAPYLKLTLTQSENNQVVIDSQDEIKENLLANIAAKYRLGKNFEPQTYFTIVDAPWCSQVLLEYSLDDGVTYQSTVYDANYDDLFECLLDNITLVEV